MRFRMLGPLLVDDGASWSAIRAAQQRLVAALLLLEAGRTVPVERLVDELWGERPPPSAAATVRGYVMRLRRLLGGGPGSPLVTRGRGYELVAEDGDIDARVFSGLVTSARQALAGGHPETAAAKLSQGLALWRGPALADVPARLAVTAEAERLGQLRLAAVEDWLGVQLELGAHAEVVDEAQRLVAEHPLRERLWARLMLAQYRCGRRAEALDAYLRARRVLVEELGLEPGPELHELQRAVLAGQPELLAPAHQGAVAIAAPARVVPAQLPAEVAAFSGRQAALEQLDSHLPDQGERQSPAIVLIAGTAGVGKTALAVHWAHRVRDRFPDGQLYVDLRGWAAGAPLRPIDALAGFLPALGVPAAEVPHQVEQAAALYRSLLAGKRVLIVLDNARSPGQVRPLLPASPGCAVVLSSRDQLRGLVARDGAVRLDLDVLAPREARTLLTRLLSAERVTAEPEAAAELVRLCGHLPLALRIAAANLSGRPRTTVAAYAAELATGDRLRALEAGEDADAAVRVAFDRSYAALPAAARRLFRLLGLVPGTGICPPAAAALAATDDAAAAVLLDRLASAHLAGEHAPNRYVLHDLLRRYAADRASAEDSPADREAALGRLLDHYLHSVDPDSPATHRQHTPSR
jgi:DNA-binding SARP family transcriptional activator